MKSFKTQTVLTIATGRMIADDIGDVYEILNYMTDDEIFTHQIPRAIEEAGPILMQTYPDLVSCKEEAIASMSKDNAIEFRDKWITKFGPELTVPKIPKGDHTVKNPLQELQ